MSGHPIPDAALDSDIAVLGRKGGGKTFTSKGIVERLLGMGRRVLVLDPLGVWTGLRTAADGESPGYPVAIFGGERADMPLDPAAAEAMAGVLAAENVPAVLDLSDLSKTAQGAFLARFLHELRRVNREALTIVLEEADVFAPQNPQGDDSKLLHGEIDWIARRGRFRGFRLISITQRPARLSKDVLTQAATLIAHKLPAPQDREAVKAWVEGNGDRDRAREVFDTLAKLDVGEAWVWSPENDILGRFRFPRIRTLDTSATPKAGEQRIEPKTLADVDVSGIRAALAAATPEKPAKTRQAASAAEIAQAERRGYERGLADGQQRGLSRARTIIAAALDGAIYGEEIEIPAGSPAPTDAPVAKAPSRPELPVAKPVAVASATDSSIGSERKPLAVLAGQHPGGLSEAQWALASGYKRSGGTWGTYKSRLRSAGLIEARDGRWFATAEGLAAVGESVVVIPSDPRERVEFWAGKLSGAGRMLRHLSARYPATLKRAELAGALSMSAAGGTFGTYLSRLRSNGLIEEDRRGIRASAALMEARP